MRFISKTLIFIEEIFLYFFEKVLALKNRISIITPIESKHANDKQIIKFSILHKD